MATTSKIKGFKLRCPFCNEGETITLDLNDFTICTYTFCDEVFSPETVRNSVAKQLVKWEAVCAWIAKAGDCLAEGDGDTKTEETD